MDWPDKGSHGVDVRRGDVGQQDEQRSKLEHTHQAKESGGHHHEPAGAPGFTTMTTAMATHARSKTPAAIAKRPMRRDVIVTDVLQRGDAERCRRRLNTDPLSPVEN